MRTASPRCEGWAIALKKIEALLSKLHTRKRQGIRGRMMVYLVLFVAFVIFLLWLFQIVLLDDFYSAYKRGEVTHAADAVAENMRNTDLPVLLEHLAAKSDVCIMILDENQQPYLSAEGLRECLLHRMSERDLAWWVKKAAKDGKHPQVEYFATLPFIASGYNANQFVGPVPEEDTSQNMSMIYARQVKLPGGQTGTLLINALITPVTSTVNTLRFQLVTLTAIVLLTALLLAYTISRNISRPIIETNDAAKELSRSRFTQPPHGNSYREIAELNATLTTASVELGKVESLQHELIANISHDLRTPLTMIGGYAEVMRDIPDERSAENMQIILDETSRLSTLVNELLDFSRLQTGSVAMNVTKFDLTKSIEEIIGRIGKLTAKDGYVIRFAPETCVTVSADETRIGQVVYNLIGNALTYTGADKTVTLTQTVKDETVRICVSDTGKGIPADELELIWNRYYRTKETHKRAVVGSGLGLNIVRTILEQHGAQYGVDSKVGHGTTFWFELPLCPQNTAS